MERAVLGARFLRALRSGSDCLRGGGGGKVLKKVGTGLEVGVL